MSFADFYVQEGDTSTFCYRSGTTVYEEALKNGVFVSQGWNAAGYPLNVLTNCPTRWDDRRFAQPFAFDLEVDGVALISDFRLVDHRADAQENGQTHCTVVLETPYAPVRVHVHTMLDGTAVLTRWLVLENRSSRELRVGKLGLLCGGLECLDESLLSDVTAEEPLYSLGYFDGTEWGEEGLFSWHPLSADGTFVDTRFGRDRYRHPLMMIRNHRNGHIWCAQVGYSGGCRFSVDWNRSLNGRSSALSFKTEVTGYAPLLVLRPHEQFRTPEVHIGLIHGDLDEAVNAMHAHARRSVFSLSAPLWVGAGMGAEHDMSVVTSKAFIDQFAQMGAEVFIVDAGWQNPPHQEMDWESYNGRNYPDRERYPNGLSEVVDYCHQKGMKFALWVEMERLGVYSEAYKAHPEWRLCNLYGEQAKGYLDFTNPEVVAWAESELGRIIEESGMDMLRIDHNSHALYYHTMKPLADGTPAYTAVRHMMAVEDMYARLKARYPHVVFENCAGGGGRTDYGFMRSFHHTWVSDWQKMPRSALITNGMTMALPPERVDRLFAGMGCHTVGSLEAHLHNTMFGHMSLNVIAPASATVNAEQMATVQKYVRLYKEKIRPFLPTCLVFHATPDYKQAQADGMSILEITAADRSRGLIGVFLLSDGVNAHMIPRGIVRSKRYRVQRVTDGDEWIMSGQALLTEGIVWRCRPAMSSELIYYEEVSQ